MENEKIINATLILLLVFASFSVGMSPAFAKIGATPKGYSFLFSNLFSIFRNVPTVEGEAQQYFDKCNPCIVNVEIKNEKQYFSDVRFNMQVSGGVGRNVVECITITSDDINYGDNIWARSMWCQNQGFKGYGVSAGGRDYDTCGGISSDCRTWKGKSCVGSQIKCWGAVTYYPTKVTMKNGGTVVWNMEGIKQTTGTDNIAPIINVACSKNIEACFRDESDLNCRSTCKVPFEVQSNLRGGGFRIDSEPYIVQYVQSGLRPNGELIEVPISQEDSFSVADISEQLNDVSSPLNVDLPESAPTSPELPSKPPLTWVSEIIYKINKAICDMLPKIIC